MGQKALPTITIAQADGSCKRRINAKDLDQYTGKGYAEYDTSKEVQLPSQPHHTEPPASDPPESTEIVPDAPEDSSDEFAALTAEMTETAQPDEPDEPEEVQTGT